MPLIEKEQLSIVYANPETGNVTFSKTTIIERDGVEISRTKNHTKTISVLHDLDKEPELVRNMALLVRTPELIATEKKRQDDQMAQDLKDRDAHDKRIAEKK